MPSSFSSASCFSFSFFKAPPFPLLHDLLFFLLKNKGKRRELIFFLFFFSCLFKERKKDERRARQGRFFHFFFRHSFFSQKKTFGRKFGMLRGRGRLGRKEGKGNKRHDCHAQSGASSFFLHGNSIH